MEQSGFRVDLSEDLWYHDHVMTIFPKNRVAVVSIAASIVTLALKFTAYQLSGSVGLLSDAAESLVNLAAGLIAFTALLIASRPADENHAYGHDKVEYFASSAEGALILIAAGSIAWTAVDRFLHPRPLENLPLPLAVALAASAVNFGVSRYLLRAARHFDSITLEADAKHLMTDVWTSVGVVAGLGVVTVTGWQVLDPVMALLVAANIVRTGFDLIQRSSMALMDTSLPADEMAAIRRTLEGYAAQGLEYHALRSRRSGPRRFVDLHLLVPGRMTVAQAHDLSQRVEADIAAALGDAYVQVHIEPVEDSAAADALPWEEPANGSTNPGQ